MPINSFPITTVPPSANLITNVPAGIVSATNVQTAINQLASAIPSPGPGTDPLTLSQGLTVDLTNPNFSFNTGECWGTKLQYRYENVDQIDPGFTNQEGLRITMQCLHADETYSSATQHKTTMYPATISGIFYAGGQRFCLALDQHSYGMGDCGLLNMFHEFAAGPISGDEGQGYTPVTRIYQQESDRRTTISNVHRALGNTTITPAIVASQNPQTVAVGSTTNINAGEWYVVEHQIGSPEFNTEAVQIISKGPSTITAIFRNNHPAGVTLTPALCMDQTNGTIGQLRVLVNLSGASYTASNVTSATGGALLGGATVWTNNMVGGDVKNIGAISLTKDELTTSPGDPSYPYRSWYEIQSVNSNTNMTVVSFSVAADTSYRSTRGTFPSTYQVRPAVRILRVLPGASLVCDTTSTVWNNGNTCEIAVCPYPDISGFELKQFIYTPGATNRAVMTLTNNGPVPCDAGLGIGGRYNNTQIGADKPYTAVAGITLDLVKTGISITGVSKSSVPDALAMQIYNGLPIDWFGSKIFGSEADNSFRIQQGSTTTNGVDFLPTSFEVNADPNLFEANFKRYWINMTGITNVAKPYLIMDKSELRNFNNTLGGTKPIEMPNGAQGFLVNTRTDDPTALNSAIHSGGMGTAGALSTAQAAYTASNGLNDISPTTYTSFIRVTGPTGAFSIQSISIGSWGPSLHAGGDGVIFRIFNATAQAMTIVNNAAAGSAKIFTLTGANVVLAARTSFATFIYSGADTAWILTGTN